jgi:hypothetical protein
MKRPLLSFEDLYERWSTGRCGRGRPPSRVGFRRLYDRWRHREYYRRNTEWRRQQRLESQRALGKAHRYVTELRRSETLRN